MKKPKFNFQESSKTIYDFMMAYFLPHWDFLSVLFNAWDIALQCAAPLRKLKGVSYIRKGVFPCKISWHTLGNHSNCAACINYTPSKTSRHSNGESLPLRRQKMDLQTLHWTSRIAKKVNSRSCIGQMEKIIKSPSHHYCIKDVVAQGKVLQFPLSFLEGNNHIIDKMKAIVSEKPNNCWE